MSIPMGFALVATLGAAAQQARAAGFFRWAETLEAMAEQLREEVREMLVDLGTVITSVAGVEALLTTLESSSGPQVLPSLQQHDMAGEDFVVDYKALACDYNNRHMGPKLTIKEAFIAHLKEVVGR